MFVCTLSASSKLASAARVAPGGSRGVRTYSQKQIVVCTNSKCSKKGGRATLQHFKEMCPEGVKIIGQNCLDECPMGPNCGIGDEPYKVINEVKTREDVAAVFRSIGVEPVMASSDS